MKILIVENDSLVADAISQFLSHTGHQVVGIARDNASALDRVVTESPDLVLMDVQLESASSAIEAALEMQAENSVHVVFMTAQHDGRSRAWAEGMKSAGILSKPFSPKDLLSAISSREIGSPVVGSALQR
jgi:DNA-binding response OmpR family regulator